MSEELNRFQRIKSLLQDTKLIDSHTISLVVAECDMALTQRPAAQAGEVELAFDQGWRMAAEWANRDDLIPDMDSPHYAKERSDRLASLPTQPAAQDEREADEVFLPRRLAATQKLTQLDYRYDSAHGKWLPAPQQATPEPDDAQRRFEAGCVVLEYLRDIGAPYRAVHHMLIALHGDPEAKSKATPEPVGEPHQFPPPPEGWPARFRCDSCDGNGEVGELVSMGHFQPPERQTCPDCGGRGWTSEEPAFNAEHMREFAETHARCTRPAPGVPEGFALVPVEPTPEMKAAGINVEVYSEASDSIGALTWAEVAEIYRSMLAAAQAKGADK